MLLWLMKIPTQYKLIMSIWQSKEKWQCKWCHLVVKSVTNACDATWLLILQTMQLVPTGGQIWNKCIRTKCETLPEAQRTQGIESIELELSFGLN